MTGSCCLAMCHVARGWASCYFEYDVGGLWDVCVGIIIVEEAGGVVVLPNDGSSILPCTSGKQKLSCGNATIVQVVREQQAIEEVNKMESDTDSKKKKFKHNLIVLFLGNTFIVPLHYLQNIKVLRW